MTPLISDVVASVFVGGELVVGAAFLAHLGACRLGARGYRPLVVPEEEEEGPLLEVVVFTCGETPEVVGRTLKAAAPLLEKGVGLRLVVNGPSTEDDEAMEALAQQHGVRFVRWPPQGSKARVMRKVLDELQRPYVIFLDADEAPVATELLAMTRRLHHSPQKMAFIQGNNGALARTEWQRWEATRLELYREVVCRARDTVGRVHFVGTTAVLRVEVLRKIGLPDWSVTEDNALSALLHFSGWHSGFHAPLSSLGLPCESLPAFWRQQRRWSHGNLVVLGWVLRQNWAHPPRNRTQLALFLGYLLSGSFFPAAALWSITQLSNLIALLLGWVQPSLVAFHLIWLVALMGILPGPQSPLRVLRVLLGNLIATPGYLMGGLRAFTGRAAIFDVSVKDPEAM